MVVEASATIAAVTGRLKEVVVVFAFATHASAAFLLAMSTIGLKSGVLPRWLGRAGYVVGMVLLAFVAVWDWVILVLPAWVAVIGLHILGRERARQRAA